MTASIPVFGSEEREGFNQTIFGTIDHNDGSFHCVTCRTLTGKDDETRIYGVNIAPYSLVCHKCKELVISGLRNIAGAPLCMFPIEE